MSVVCHGCYSVQCCCTALCAGDTVSIQALSECTIICQGTCSANKMQEVEESETIFEIVPHGSP